MPSKSKAQHNLMAMVANDPKAAKRLGISQKVGKEFMKADKGKKFASGGMSRPAALERRRQQEYLERNPQYREREKGLEGVYPEEFVTPGGVSKAGSGVMAAVKAGAYRDPKAKRAADKAMRERIKEAESKKDKLRATSPASAPYKNPNRSPYEPRPQSDEILNLEPYQKATLAGAVGKGAAIMALDEDQRRKKAERERAEKAKKETEEKSQSSYRKGGSVKSSASSRADGIAQRGKTRGKFI